MVHARATSASRRGVRGIRANEGRRRQQRDARSVRRAGASGAPVLAFRGSSRARLNGAVMLRQQMRHAALMPSASRRAPLLVRRSRLRRMAVARVPDVERLSAAGPERLLETRPLRPFINSRPNTPTAVAQTSTLHHRSGVSRGFGAATSRSLTSRARGCALVRGGYSPGSR
jgi:hypothetical protein